MSFVHAHTSNKDSEYRQEEAKIYNVRLQSSTYRELAFHRFQISFRMRGTTQDVLHLPVVALLCSCFLQRQIKRTQR